MTSPKLVLLAVAVTVHAQYSDINSAPRIQSCAQLACINPNSSSPGQGGTFSAPCFNGTDRANGVGIVGDVFAGPNDTSLSVTLVDDGSDGGSGDGILRTHQKLFIGTPPDLDVADQPPACALMLQYQGQTYPNVSSMTNDSTTCSPVFQDACLDGMTDVIQNFTYSEFDSDDDASFPTGRCDLLASHVRSHYLSFGSLCGLEPSFVNITGGAYFGPDAPSSPVDIQSDGCQPVVPEQNQLRRVIVMRQVFRPGGDLFPDATNEQNEGLLEPQRGAGRQGITPVVSVQYSSDNGTAPRVEYTCMRTFAPNGEVLPNELVYPSTGGSARTSVGAMCGVVVAAILMQIFC